MKKSTSRLKKRQDERKAILYRIVHGGDHFDKLTEPCIGSEQCRNLVFEIERNNVAVFGLRKLHQQYLNESIEIFHFKLLNGINICKTSMTLLEYSSLLNRDIIVSSLIRAGAAPREIFLSRKFNVIDLTKVLITINPSYAIWIVK